MNRYDWAAPESANGLWDWDLTTSRIHFSPEWTCLLGFAGTDLGSTVEEWFKRIHPEDIESVQKEISDCLAQGSSNFEIRHRMIHKDGCYRWMACQGSISRDQTGRATRITGRHVDMTPEKVVDTLTGLPNRILAVDRLTRSVDKANNNSDFIFAVLILDLDLFESGIDCLESVNVDSLIISAARRIETALRNQVGAPTADRAHLVARSGGTEFLILLDGLGKFADAKIISDHLLKEMLVPFEFRGQEVFLSPSIGIALSGTGYSNADEVLRDADTALYRAKSFGKSRSEIFDTALLETTQSREMLEQDLREALDRNQLVLYYQPILCLSTNRVVGFEALIRWNHPSKGLVGPMDFIPIAERNGCIIPIGRWTVQQACRQLKAWREELHISENIWISVNLSGNQFSHPLLANEIRESLAETGLNTSGLMLELTEGTVMRNPEAARSTLMQLRVLGARVGLDDFGTGYSSLAHLRRFPLDFLKIDHAFIKNIESGGDSFEIVRTIFALARQLGLQIIAEGIENHRQLELLRSLQCDYGQGFLFSQAVESGAAAKLLLDDPAIEKANSHSSVSEAAEFVPTPTASPLYRTRPVWQKLFAGKMMFFSALVAAILLASLILVLRIDRPASVESRKIDTGPSIAKTAEAVESPLKANSASVPIKAPPVLNPAAASKSVHAASVSKPTKQFQAVQPVVYQFQVTHDHALGSCRGVLKFDKDSISFISEKGKDSFYFSKQEYTYLLDRDWLVIKTAKATYRFKSAIAQNKAENRSQLSDIYQTVCNLYKENPAD